MRDATRSSAPVRLGEVSLKGRRARVALALMLAATGPAFAQQSRPELVRVEALRTYIHGITAEIARERIGAAGIPALLELAADPSFPRRDNVVAYLGWLGGEESTTALLRLLGAPPARLTLPEEDRAMLLAPQSLGQIAGRGEPRALGALLDMTAHEAGGGAAVAAVARRAPFATLDSDLLEMAMRGLAYAHDARATARLRAIERGTVRPLGARRDLRTAATSALGLAAELDARTLVAPAASGRRLDGADPASGLGGPAAAGLARIAAPAAGGAPLSVAVDAVFDSTHADVKQSRLTYANHPAVSNPMTNGLLDQILAAASLVLGRADFVGDVACCAGLARSGNAQTFGTNGDGLDKIDNSNELDAVLDDSVARVKVVRQINFCAGPGTNIIGCGWVGGWGIALVRASTLVLDEGTLWAHEYGHNVGLGHNSDSHYVMYSCLCGTSFGLTQAECNSFHTPAAGTSATLIDVGACTDVDADDVQDQIDNCPGAANNSQSDGNGDGVGDVCQDGCGNDILDPGEQCDVSQLGGATCTSLGYPGGTLSCSLACTFGESNCIGGPTRTPTPTFTRTPTPTRTPTRTPTPIPTPTLTPTLTRTATPTATATSSRTPTAAATSTATATSTLAPSVTPTLTPTLEPPPFDIDGNHVTEPYTDGVLITRWLFDLRSDALIATAVAGDCSRCDASEIEAHLASIVALLDVDGNGDSNALTDGVLVLRWLLDVQGDALIAGAVDTVKCSRCTTESISEYISDHSL